ncbi:ABC transporter permease [Agathobaculum sp.]|uniref:ABC transporter permease n=1 Tax=Agathobaculum sp. TaxID=2048138 RepID=UPI0027B8E34D|nr:ABC transporter permease [Agathobaculum sp.]
MTPQKRALLYICRKKKFSILLFLLLALLSSACLMGIIMVRGLEDTQSTLRRTFAGSFYVSTDWNSVGTHPENVPGFEFLNDEMAERIGDFEGITAVNATAYDFLASDELTLIPGAHARYLKETDPADASYKNKLYFTKSPSYAFNSYSELAPEFRMGQYTLVKGRHITPEDTHVAIISDVLAEQNGLDVGDSYYVYDYDVTGAFPNYNGIDFDLTIVGIYHVEAQQKTTKFTNESDIAANKVFSDTHTNVETKQRADDYVYYPFVYFFVDDPARIDEIMAAEQERDDIPWEYYLIEADETEYASVAEPLRSMHTTIIVVTCIVAVVLLILLYLVLRMSLQSRKQETRVYRCLGYSKRNIWGQFVIEGVLLALLAFIPAAALAPPCTDAMGGAVENIVAAQNEEPPEYSEAEIAAAMRDGSFVNMMEDMQKLYLDEPVEIDMDTGLTLPVVLASMAAGLAAVVLFVSIQSRELLNAGLR